MCRTYVNHNVYYILIRKMQSKSAAFSINLYNKATENYIP